ncbi:MAG: hypothetical protein ACKVS6_01320, partial [Planctomycetota bacterium]
MNINNPLCNNPLWAAATLFVAIVPFQDSAKPATAPATQPAASQPKQFELIEGAFGGPSYKIKCEGVDIGDLDGDGKLDVVFATGFVLRPDKQEPHIPQIQMNRSSGIGNF